MRLVKLATTYINMEHVLCIDPLDDGLLLTFDAPASGDGGGPEWELRGENAAALRRWLRLNSDDADAIPDFTT